MSTPAVIAGPVDEDLHDACAALLLQLEAWFGLPDARADYAADTRRLPCFTARADGQLVGLAVLREHFAESAELHLIAVHSGWHRRGVGAALLDACERWLTDRGAQLLQVKTLDAGREDEGYARTRAFYRARGFVPLEVFPELWDPRNPCLQLVKVLAR
jgi:GNAT superfamily N-acetyltransferase